MQQDSKPLWQRLNEERTQGEWQIIEPLKLNEYKVGTEDMSICDFPAIDIEDEEGMANAQYTALAVNNLASLAEILDRIVGSMALERVERFDLLSEAKEALNKIS